MGLTADLVFSSSFLVVGVCLVGFGLTYIMCLGLAAGVVMVLVGGLVKILAWIRGLDGF